MVTGQLTRGEAESGLRRLEGLRDEWRKQITRWREHHDKAENIRKIQQSPSAPLSFTCEVCLNQVGVATIRYNELERLIQDFQSCALYLVHLPVPQEPDASFKASLPDLWSIPQAAPGTVAVALPGHLAGAEAQLAPTGSLQGLSQEIHLLAGGGFNDGRGQGMQAWQQGAMPGMMTGMMTGQPAPTPMYSPQPSPYGYASQPLNPQHTAALYGQQQAWQQQNAQQERVNQFGQNVFQPGYGGAPQQQPQRGGVSALNPFNPTPPHGAVMDASRRFPAVQ